MKNWVRDTIFDLIREGGKLVPDEVFDKRVLACKVCPHFGTVNPLPTIYEDGCTLCGCPLATKAKMLTYFSPAKIGQKLSECSQFEKQLGEDRWAEANLLLSQTT